MGFFVTLRIKFFFYTSKQQQKNCIFIPLSLRCSAKDLNFHMGAARKLSLISESQPRPTVAAAVAPFVSAIIYSIVLPYFIRTQTDVIHTHIHIWRIYMYTVLGLRVIQCGTFNAFSGLNFCFHIFFLFSLFLWSKKL